MQEQERGTLSRRFGRKRIKTEAAPDNGQAKASARKKKNREARQGVVWPIWIAPNAAARVPHRPAQPSRTYYD